MKQIQEKTAVVINKKGASEKVLSARSISAVKNKTVVCSAIRNSTSGGDTVLPILSAVNNSSEYKTSRSRRSSSVSVPRTAPFSLNMSPVVAVDDLNS